MDARARYLLFPMAVWLLAGAAYGQENYEIQVYGVETVAPGRTMVELHNNFTVEWSKETVDGVRPTEHQWHETIEITHGFTPWFETAIYIFTSAQPGYGWSWVGDHIRPRFRAPEKWRLPVGLSLSQEFGYQRRAYSADTWTWEIRPIIDKAIGSWYLSFNPTFDKSFHGENAHRGFEFSPNFKFSYDIWKKKVSDKEYPKRLSAGLEYYGAFGPVTGFDPLHDQQQQIMPAIDLDVSPNWEFNLAVGVGTTAATDHLLVKMIVGYRFKH
jgi:hypothetical protein